MDKKKAAKQIIRALDSTLSTVFTAVLLLLLLFSAYIGVDNYRIVKEADSTVYQAYKPVEDDAESFQKLALKNPDVIGWLTIDDTNIDYPLVQGENNETYINKSVLGEFSLSGAIFLDSRNDTHFSDTLSVVYGHNMTGDVMFGGLDNFADPEYFGQHLTGTLFHDGDYYRLHIFAYFTADGHDVSVYRVGLDQQERDEWLSQIRDIAVNYKSDGSEKGPILLMSTCAVGETSGRTLLAATIEAGGTPPGPRKTETISMRILQGMTSGGEWLTWPRLLVAALLLLALTILFYRRRNRKGGED